MTILPKKKPPASDPDDTDRRSGADSHPRAGARPRASPPRWAYQTAPSPREERQTSSRPQQASVQASGSGAAGPGSGDGGVGSGGVVVGVSGGGCCSGPGHSKRRRQAAGVGPGAGVVGAVGPSGVVVVGGAGGVGGNASPEQEEGAGYNSEDEYETAARTQSVDPATAEQEHWFEKTLKEKKGFVIKQMKEDGACLFRAVADQVYGDQDMHDVVRKHCMDYLMKNADYFSNYVTEDFTTYINRKRKNNCHGNHIEMQAMAEMYNRPVEVYQYGTDPINTFHGIQQNEDEPIRVSYHRNIHYNSVVNPNKATIGVGLGLPSFKPGYAEQSLMKNAIKTSEESWIEQQMLEDKKRATDWEATNEAIEEQVARESYLQWLRDQEKQARQPRKASATCSSATAAASSGFEEWSGRSPRQRSSASSPEHPNSHTELNVKPPSPGMGAALALAKPPSPCAPGTSSQSIPCGDRATSPLVSLYPALDCRALMQQMSPNTFGLKDWEDDEILASVLAVSQQEYLDSMKKGTVHRAPTPDKS
ncbi:OTU domain-containing protein 5-A isoform X2 [Latimeria chalumnae]|uniref:OTU domain-containing protein 5-A isoform X2 n=1 Tax=Latimeria chalumnae TaxID=7897 RepID=UPI0003C168B9|nr:PREDICTED: OTU domain-containing protein 5 isoform X2 [Latimeria chalumnae]|eukprot:XP_006005463.1 PREDICTED: OTU domain-containing protein 5 isoform X2 [Latimeria chalumnae]